MDDNVNNGQAAFSNTITDTISDSSFLDKSTQIFLGCTTFYKSICGSISDFVFAPGAFIIGGNEYYYFRDGLTGIYLYTT